MNDKKKKKYEEPKAEVLDFSSEDIMTTSGNAKWWNGDDNQEGFPF